MTRSGIKSYIHMGGKDRFRSIKGCGQLRDGIVSDAGTNLCAKQEMFMRRMHIHVAVHGDGSGVEEKTV